MAARKRPGRRAPGAALFRRWLVVAVVGFVAFLYYRPLSHYVEARSEVARAETEVRLLQSEQFQLQKRLAAQRSTESLIREARRLAYVKPGEQLFIVKGIPEWREARRGRIGGDGRP